MRLLNVRSFIVEEYLGESVPPYAILSHTWGTKEVGFEDMKTIRSRDDFISIMQQCGGPEKDYNKILRTAEFARSCGDSHVWIDTCCIDKSSSAELSEAINSMFAWYRDAKVCYAYLADVNHSGYGMGSMGQSRWFHRGWTLQELIAPSDLLFLDSNWQPIGRKSELVGEISAITKVDAKILSGTSLDGVCAAVRMSWAANRQTTRPEDIAYCLLGLFGVNMPLLYGEGKEKAFLRLQEEFLKISDDESIFAWRAHPEVARRKPHWGLLAPTPHLFNYSSDYSVSRLLPPREGQPTMVTNRGLRVELSLSPFTMDESNTTFVALLNCSQGTGWAEPTAILLQRLSDHENQYARVVVDTIIHANRLYFRFPWCRIAEPYKSRREPGKMDITMMMPEIQPKYIFVRQAPRPSGQLLGIYVDLQTYCNPSNSIQPDSTLSISVSQQVGPWETLKPQLADERPGLSFMLIDFSREGIEGLDSVNLKERRLLGRMAVDITRDTMSERLFLAVGMEPLPENPFGTVAGYTRPWCSLLRDGIDGSPEATHNITCHLLRRYRLEVDFALGTHWGSMCYKMTFSIEGMGSEDAKSEDTLIEP